MSEPYELYMIFVHGAAPRHVILASHERLIEAGAELEAESGVRLNPIGACEPDNKPFYQIRDALQHLLQWPALGSLEYSFRNKTLDVIFDPVPGESSVQAVVILVGARMFEDASADFRNDLISIGETLHEELQATRTLMAWGLRRQGFDLAEEVERLSAGQFRDGYELTILDLRRV